MDDGDFEWDLFISHASEDQARFVRPLANALIQAGYRVWYSEWALHLGDPLRSTIERGLVLSRYGVVVVSDAFLAKQWPQRELDALFTLEGDGDRRILPIWHNIDESGIRMHSPILADRVAAQSHESLETIVARIGEAIDRAPTAPAPSPEVTRRRTAALADIHLQRRSLDDPRRLDFGRNPDLEAIRARRGQSEETQTPVPVVVYSLAPLSDEVRLDWREILSWADEPHDGWHPLHNNDARPRGEGAVLWLRDQYAQPKGTPSRFTFISPEGYVEWGRTFGGAFAPDSPNAIRLGPLLWGTVHLVEFLEAFRSRFSLRTDYELVVSVANANGSCLSHLGERWREPWDSQFGDFHRPTTSEPNVQYRADLPARISRADTAAIALDLDVYLNRVWGCKEPRGHNHPDSTIAEPGGLPTSYERSDPWE